MNRLFAHSLVWVHSFNYYRFSAPSCAKDKSGGAKNISLVKHIAVNKTTFVAHVCTLKIIQLSSDSASSRINEPTESVILSYAIRVNSRGRVGAPLMQATPYYIRIYTYYYTLHYLHASWDRFYDRFRGNVRHCSSGSGTKLSQKVLLHTLKIPYI